MSRFDLFFVLVDECSESVDYAVARKIVELHNNIEAPLVKQYSKSDILLFLGFSKNFKPILSEGAASRLVYYYGKLRARDSQSGRWSWRITVRQLESMIRLAEAMARLQVCDKVLELHIEEAFRLLNKSIIRVEQPDIYLENDIAMDEAMLQIADDVEDIEEDGLGATNVPLTLGFDEFKTMSNMIIMYLRRVEAEMEEKGMLSFV